MATELDPRPFLDTEPESWLRRTQGRETFVAEDPRAPGRRVVVKRTTGGPRGERWFDRLRLRRGASPGRVEYENLLALSDAGVPVPQAISWCDERSRAGARRSLVVMEHVEHSETLRERLSHASARERRALLGRLAGLVARLHAAGWHHRDLYVQHVLLRARDDAFVLIDVGRARRGRPVRPRWFVKDLAAVLHSLPESVTAQERLRLLAAWLDELGIDARGARRRWIQAAERKRARIAAHVPRDERELVAAGADARTAAPSVTRSAAGRRDTP